MEGSLLLGVRVGLPRERRGEISSIVLVYLYLYAVEHSGYNWITETNQNLVG